MGNVCVFLTTPILERQLRKLRLTILYFNTYFRELSCCCVCMYPVLLKKHDINQSELYVSSWFFFIGSTHLYKTKLIHVHLYLWAVVPSTIHQLPHLQLTRICSHIIQDSSEAGRGRGATPLLLLLLSGHSCLSPFFKLCAAVLTTVLVHHHHHHYGDHHRQSNSSSTSSPTVWLSCSSTPGPSLKAWQQQQQQQLFNLTSLDAAASAAAASSFLDRSLPSFSSDHLYTPGSSQEKKYIFCPSVRPLYTICVHAN